jgi:YidC/Oxa1 family membrane protein insertase
MDRTSYIGLFVCLALLLILQFTVDKYYPLPPSKPLSSVVTTPPTAATAPAASPAASTPTLSASPGSPTAPAPAAAPAEKLSVLENDAIKITFTSLGAAIKNVELKRYKSDTGGNIILNSDSRTNVLTLTGWPGLDTAVFDVRENPPDSVVYSTDLPGGVQWQRTYAFGQTPEKETGLGGVFRGFSDWISVKLGKPVAKPYVYWLDVTDTVTNPAAAAAALPPFNLGLGRADPLYDPPTKWSKRSPSRWNSQYLGAGWLTTRFHPTTVNDFQPGYVPIIGIKTRDGRDAFSSAAVDPAPLHWLGVENQFFTVLLTPSSDHLITQGQFQCFSPRDPESGKLLTPNDPDIEAAASFPGLTVPAGQAVTLSYNLYAGPKDFNRLDSLGSNQGELMNYDGFLPFSLLIIPMLAVLHFWYLIFNNYGVAIILLTFMIKAITWPLQSKANHSGKKMQALAPKLKELQAKYKEQPEKLQTETFAMYRDYGVNPFGGCLPAFVQMPVFFSLYFMLQNAIELRGQSFLWVHDLTKPDTIFTLPYLFFGYHLGLNPLPIMVTLLMMVMMRMTPQIGDPQQAKIAQIMPLFFLFIMYNLAAALSLYYVINNGVSIIQIYRNLRKPLPELKRVPRKK